MIKAIIFDCFGVVIADGLEAIVVEHEREDPAVRPFVRETIGRSNRGEIEPAESHKIVSDYLSTSSHDLQRRIFSGERRNEPLIELIRHLRKTYKTALLSNVGKDSLKHRFSDKELAIWFDTVVVSGELGIAKPDPEIYRHTAAQLGVTVAECVFIDDRQIYVDGARQAGMRAILYQDFDQMKAELEKLLAADTEG